MAKQTVERLGRRLVWTAAVGASEKWKIRCGNWIRTSTRMRSDGGDSISISIPREKVDCVVIGAGVVGIAVARALALKGRDVFVIESAPTFGTVTSSRNSEVIHAGIYYPRHSFKVPSTLTASSIHISFYFAFSKSSSNFGG